MSKFRIPSAGEAREVIGSLFKTTYNIHDELEVVEMRLRDIAGMQQLVTSQTWKRYAELVDEQMRLHREVIMELAKNAGANHVEILKRACIVEALSILMNVPASIIESYNETESLYKRIKTAINKLNPAKAG